MQRRPRIDLPEETWEAIETFAEENGYRREYAYALMMKRGFEQLEAEA
jgi:hypothetical protein